MNQLSPEARARVIACLVEGNSLRSVTRITGTHRTTCMKLLADLGRACSVYQDAVFRNLPCKRIQCDETWSYIGAKAKNATPEQKAEGWGDCWTWIALCPDTKLIPCWFIGGRDAGAAYHFMHDLAGRLASRVQLTTDGHNAYLSAVESAFGNEIDFAQLVKIYGATPSTPETRYSPAVCMGAKKAKVTGSPDFAHVSTSHVERANLTLRMGNRRFTRLTNAFSKKFENHEHSLALHFMVYNFCKIHGSLRVTPGMAAGVTSRVWELTDLVALLDSPDACAA
jgi:IS1 family transposase